MPKKNNAPPTVSTCHPERKHAGHGLCKPCYDAQYGAAHRDSANAKKRAWGQANPKRRLEILRKYLYGVTPEEVNEQLEKQGGLCAICVKAPASQLDHDHVSGKMRGLLCSPCNQALGLFGDDCERLERAIDYLLRFRSSLYDDRCVQVESNTGRLMGTEVSAL